MENYPITISVDKKVHHFEVGEYVHHVEDKCKYRVFENGDMSPALRLMITTFCISVKILPVWMKKYCTYWLTRSSRTIRKESMIT